MDVLTLYHSTPACARPDGVLSDTVSGEVFVYLYWSVFDQNIDGEIISSCYGISVSEAEAWMTE